MAHLHTHNHSHRTGYDFAHADHRAWIRANIDRTLVSLAPLGARIALFRSDMSAFRRTVLLRQPTERLRLCQRMAAVCRCHRPCHVDYAHPDAFGSIAP